MKTIHKYNIDQCGGIIQMPAGYEIISAQNQNEKIVIWAIVSAGNPLVDVWIAIYGTGFTIPNRNEMFIATVQMSNGLVWHLFLVR